MKIAQIETQILNNYKKLSELVKIPQKESKITPVWGLTYKNNIKEGFVSQFGTVETRNIHAKINNDQINILKKPFFKTTKQALRQINNLIKNVLENIDNKNLVKKKQVNFLCFNKEDISRIERVAAQNGIKL